MTQETKMQNGAAEQQSAPAAKPNLLGRVRNAFADWLGSDAAPPLNRSRRTNWQRFGRISRYPVP